MYNERTLRMMENFMQDFENGMTIPEIADKYHLSARTVWLRLDQIAKEANVPREALLRQPNREHIRVEARNFEPVKPLDVTEFTNNLAILNREYDTVIEKMAKRVESLDTELTKENEEWK